MENRNPYAIHSDGIFLKEPRVIESGFTLTVEPLQ
jgi:hypothetical protein